LLFLSLPLKGNSPTASQDWRNVSGLRAHSRNKRGCGRLHGLASKDAGVFFVMSLGISLRVYPMASLAAILAIGKPVAFDASAELRDTRGFISMTTCRPVVGSTANWMFEPPVSTPIARMHATAASRITWYSLSVSVCAGATVIESP